MKDVKKGISEIARRIPLLKNILRIDNNLSNLVREQRICNDIVWDVYANNVLNNNPRYFDLKKLNKFEYQIYSQNGEDGIIAEIFQRIGTTNKYFVEIGVSVLENNTIALLLDGWSGLWMDVDRETAPKVNKKYSTLIKKKTLMFRCESCSPENTETIFRESNIPIDLDLLSIDIDGNDYWVWQSIRNYRPRVVIIEYNAVFGPRTKWVMAYQPNYQWDGSCYQGASLKSLEILGNQKGYKLVGCSFKGSNAFFVREDLIENKFLEPYISENHYEPPRYKHLTKCGHKRDFGDFESI